MASLREQLKRGDKSLVPKRGFRKYLKQAKSKFEIDAKRNKQEARHDGTWVLRSNTDLSAVEVELKCKQLWMVEHVFRPADHLAYSFRRTASANSPPVFSKAAFALGRQVPATGVLSFGNMALGPFQSGVRAVRLAAGRWFCRRGLQCFGLCRLIAASHGGAICPTALRDLNLAIDDGILVRR